MKQPKATPPRQRRETEANSDKGYGASHGYGPAHGGPSGPGDVPGDAHTDASPDTGEASNDGEDATRPSEDVPGSSG